MTSLPVASDIHSTHYAFSLAIAIFFGQRSPTN